MIDGYIDEPAAELPLFIVLAQSRTGFGGWWVHPVAAGDDRDGPNS